MRIISLDIPEKRRVKKGNRAFRIVFVVFVIGLVIIGMRVYRSNYLIAQPASEIEATVDKNKTLRVFSGEQFKDLYNNFRYANTDKIVDPPNITGNTTADARIRSIAESRGYRLRRLARDAIGVADGLPLQSIAVKSWNDLKEAAAKDGIVLTVTASFRTFEDQRMIFLDGLRAYGVSTQDIAEGHVDASVDKVLQTYAPPGYSRHHTGFTIDLTCGTNGLTNFATTICYRWLSADNYLHAKTYGWVPSYPDGTDLQGPEPEPWEYIWVTVDALLK